MAIYKRPDGTQLRIGKPFTLGGVQYPPNWLELSSDDEKIEIGIVIEPDPEPEPVDPIKQIDHFLSHSDEVLVGYAARAIEELLEERHAAGKFVHQRVIDLLAERKAKRAERAAI